MFGKRLTIFTIFGFKVRADASWLIVAALVTWSLAAGIFPQEYKDLSAVSVWMMAVVCALGLFLSIVVHEFFHSLVARLLGLPMEGITLFVFGGVAEMREEPETPRVEFLMAAAGPASSILLGFLFYAAYSAGTRGGWPVQIEGVLGYLASINLGLAVFNLLPAFPLDGGRILRASLWKWKKNLALATHRASTVGTGFALLMIVAGVVSFLFGNVLNGLWLFLLGMFLKKAAESSYRQLVVRTALEGTPVEKIMKRDPLTVPPNLTIARLVEDYIYKFHFKMFPVANDGRLEGCVSTRQVQRIPRTEWGHKTVGEVAVRCSSRNSVPPDYDALMALGLMSKTGNSRLAVVEEGRLLGVVSNKDLMRHIAFKLDLEGEEEEE